MHLHTVCGTMGCCILLLVAIPQELSWLPDLQGTQLPSIQMNIRAGKLPPPESNGVSYVKIMLNKPNPFA